MTNHNNVIELIEYRQNYIGYLVDHSVNVQLNSTLLAKIQI